MTAFNQFEEKYFIRPISIFFRMSIYILTEYYFKIQQATTGHHPTHGSVYFHCIYHYGDHIQNMVYLNSLAMNNKDKTIYYGINQSQIAQVKELSDQKNLLVVPVNSVSYNSIDLWKNRFQYWRMSPYKKTYYVFYEYFFNYISVKTKINNPLNSKRSLLVDINYECSDEYINFDILIVNSIPKSNQFKYSVADFNAVIKTLNSTFKVITTYKVPGVNCTTDDNLTLREIGKLSLFCKVIICISTGPSWMVLNKKNFDSGKPVLILHNGSEVVEFNSNSRVTSSLGQIIPFVNRFI
jgi:hypothetical protein